MTHFSLRKGTYLFTVPAPAMPSASGHMGPDVPLVIGGRGVLRSEGSVLTDENTVVDFTTLLRKSLVQCDFIVYIALLLL